MPTRHINSSNVLAVALATALLVTVVACLATRVMDASAQAAPMIAQGMVSARVSHTLSQMWLLNLRMPLLYTLALMQGLHMAASVTLDSAVQTARSASAHQAVTQ